jgi:hypothetical protein
MGEETIVQGAQVILWQPSQEESAVDVLTLADTLASEQQASHSNEASTQHLEAPFDDLSFSCMALHLIDATVLLLRRRDILHCVRRFHQQLLQALTSTSPELRNAILNTDCRRVDKDGRVCQEVLDHLAGKLSVVLVVREGSSLRVVGSASSAASAVIIERDHVYRITSYAQEDAKRIVSGARFKWVRDLQISNGTLCRMRKAQVQEIADALGVSYHRNGCTKDSLVKLVVDCIGTLSR